MDSRRQHADHSQDRPRSGASAPGQPFNPSDALPDQAAPCGEPLREAPNPGVPIPADEYERLKDDAIRRRAPHEAPAQEDRPQDRPED